MIMREELDDIIETHCKKMGLDVKGKEIFGYIGEFSQAIVAEKLLGELIADDFPNMDTIAPPLRILYPR